MFRIKVAFAAALGAAFAFCVLEAGTASAEGWVVQGTTLAKGATLALASTAKVDESTDIHVPSLGVLLTCTGGSSKVLKEQKPFIQGEGQLGAEGLTFQGCSEIKPSSCTIQTEISTTAVVATFEEGLSPADRIRLAPKTGKALATIEFSGTCAESGEQPLNNAVVLGASKLQEELAEQSFGGMDATENNSLELLKDRAYIEGGKTLLKLASGLKFAAVPRLRMINSRGGMAANNVEVVFGAGEEVEFVVGNLGNVDTELEKFEVKPNENNFKLVASANNECKNKEILKKNLGNLCFIAVKAQAKNEAGILRVEYGGKKDFEVDLRE
jgi:hypothetical protein